MTTKIRLYIGADNKTGKITPEYEKKIEEILSNYWKGFTLHKCKGYYEGEVEESIEAVIIVLKLIFRDLENCVSELKIELSQKEIGVEIETDVNFKFK